MHTFTGNNLSCVRGGRLVFENINFELSSGQSLVLRGPNGAGKSTLLRLMASLAQPSSGEILWDNSAINENHKNNLAYLSHQNATKNALTVREHLSGAAKVLGLEKLANLPARYLSAGQKRRVALARILQSNASLWLLDEPTNAVDKESVAELAKACEQHCAQGGMVIVATHDNFTLPNAKVLELS